MCSTNEDVQYKQGCAACANQAHLQYKHIDHQVLVHGRTAQKFFLMNKGSSLPLKYQVKIVACKN